MSNAKFCNILYAILLNIKFDLSPTATSIFLIKDSFKLIQFKLEANIVLSSKFLKCTAIVTKEDIQVNLSQESFFSLNVPLWANIIRHSSVLIESSNEIGLLNWRLIADFCGSIEN